MRSPTGSATPRSGCRGAGFGDLAQAQPARLYRNTSVPARLLAPGPAAPVRLLRASPAGSATPRCGCCGRWVWSGGAGWVAAGESGWLGRASRRLLRSRGRAQAAWAWLLRASPAGSAAHRGGCCAPVGVVGRPLRESSTGSTAPRSDRHPHRVNPAAASKTLPGQPPIRDGPASTTFSERSSGSKWISDSIHHVIPASASAARSTATGSSHAGLALPDTATS